MKKAKTLVSLLLSVMMVTGIFAVVPITANAETSGGYSYEVLDDGTASIVYGDPDEDDVVIPEKLDGYTVTEIASYAFESASMSSLVIPEGVKTIGWGAFEDCYRLTSVSIPASVTNISTMAFAYCDKLTSINVDSNNPSYSSVDGNLYDKAQTLLMQYTIGKTNATFKMPDSVVEVGEGAFENCENLSGITLSDNLVDIDLYAFSGCSNLKAISIPSSVVNIDKVAFAGCSSLKSLIIPGTVSSIGNSAFAACEGLTSITILDGVQSIDTYAFGGCTGVKSITVPESVAVIGEQAFGYYYDSNKKDYVKMNGFILYGKSGSAAQKYAVEYDVEFVATDIPQKLNKTAVSLKSGATADLKVSNGKAKSWSSSNTKVATVKNGKVTALKKGSVTITATLTTGKKLTCKVNVTSSPKLSKTSVKVKKNKTVSVKITGKAGSVKNVYINTKIAKITSKNTASTLKVKGLKKGSTTLKVKVNGVTLKLKVKVK